MVGVITLLICGLVTTAVIWLMLKRVGNPSSQKGSRKKSIESTPEDAKKLDTTIARVINAIEGMTPLPEITAKENELANLKEKLEEKVRWMSQLDAKVAELQAEVNQANEKQLALKKANAERADFANNIRADRERLELELNQSKDQLKQCQEHLSSLSQEVNLDVEQTSSVDNISNSIVETDQRLAVLEQVYKTTLDRFLGMESQFAELEKEYQRLKDKVTEGGTNT